MRAGPVAAERLGLQARCEPPRECVLVDAAVFLQHFIKTEGHRGVVGPRPRRAGGRLWVVENRLEVFVAEARLAERVADRETVERHGRALYARGMIG